jgi:hypothetical protein
MYISSSYAILLFKKRFLPAFIEGSLGLFVHRTAGDASLSHQSNTVLLVPLGGRFYCACYSYIKSEFHVTMGSWCGGGQQFAVVFIMEYS